MTLLYFTALEDLMLMLTVYQEELVCQNQNQKKNKNKQNMWEILILLRK